MKKLIRQTRGFVGASMILPVGARAVTSLGGSGAGLTAFSGQMRTVGTLIPVTAAVRMLRKLRSNKVYKPKKITVWR